MVFRLHGGYPKAMPTEICAQLDFANYCTDVAYRLFPTEAMQLKLDL